MLAGGAAVLGELRAKHADFEELGGLPAGGDSNGLPDFGDGRHGVANVFRDPAPRRAQPFGLAGVYHGEVDRRLRGALVDGGLALRVRRSRLLRGVTAEGLPRHVPRTRLGVRVRAGRGARAARRLRADHRPYGLAHRFAGSDLAEIELPEAARRYVGQEVDRRFRVPLAELEESVRSLNGNTVFSAANVAFTLPPLLGLAVGHFSGNPVIATGLGAAFGMAWIARGARQQKQAALAASPAAYLLSVKGEPAPSQLVGRIAARVRGRS